MQETKAAKFYRALALRGVTSLHFNLETVVLK